MATYNLSSIDPGPDELASQLYALIDLLVRRDISRRIGSRIKLHLCAQMLIDRNDTTIERRKERRQVSNGSLVEEGGEGVWVGKGIRYRVKEATKQLFP